MIKDVSYAAYIIPFRGEGANKEFAILKYEGGYGSIGGRFDDGETDARTALRRELTEELGLDAATLAEIAIEVPVHEISKVAPERVAIRGAYSEDHAFFVVRVPENLVLTFCEEGKGNVNLVWLPLGDMLNETVTHRSEKREFCKKHIIPLIENL